MEMKREMLYAALIILLLPVSTLTGVDVFRVPHSRVIVVEEGSEILLNCLPTIPSTTNFTLRMADGSALPPNLRFTVHPKQGILIHLPTPSHSGEYVCSMLVDTTWQNSSVFHITVKKKVRLPPSVTVDVDECIGVVGEELNLTCKATNPDHAFILKWQHSSNQTFLFNKTLSRMGGMVQVKGVITLPEVRESDAGNLTCIVENAAGKNTATVSLRITKKPFLSLTSLKPTVELREGETLELRVEIDAHPSIQNRTWSTPQTRSSSTYTETLSTVHRSYRQVASLSIRSLKADESGWYSFSARSANINATTYFKVHVVQKPSVVIEQKNSTLTCLASGYPTPRIHWQQCNETHTIYEGCDRHTAFGVLLHEEHTLQQRDDFQTHTVRSVLLTSPNSTMVECVAENKAGVGRSAITVPLLLYVSQPPHDIRASQIFLTIVTSTLVIATLLFFLLGVCVYRFIQTPKYEIQWKIIEVSEGNNYTYIDPIQLPYNLKWEFPRDRLTFGQVLGSGAFGKVVEATALGLNKDDHVTQVAVKMLKSSAHSEEKEALMCELKILSHIGSHANIVNLLGACTHGGPVLLITEFCCHGDLLNFLRRKAPYFMTSGFHTRKFSHIYKNLRENQSPVDSYMDMHPDQISRECTQGGESALNVDDLLRFSSHVAQGMNFLTSKNCIHRDVAARNVLLSDSLVAKICDFGLARDIMNDSNYVVRGNARLPVKWMSPESIFECLYTVQSDVWSYGILLWEIFSLGRSPYPDVVVDARFYKMIRCGYQMSQPDFAPDHMYKLMKMCWTLDPTSRPTFDAIVQMIKRLRPENSEQQQVYKNIQQEFVHNDDVMKWVNAETKENHCDVRAEEEERPLTHSNNYHLH